MMRQEIAVYLVPEDVEEWAHTWFGWGPLVYRLQDACRETLLREHETAKQRDALAALATGGAS
jgi:hypothetical protein